MQEGRERFLKRAAVTSVIAVPFLWFVLAPWPGLGLIYSITDPLHGHPSRAHGTQPAEFVGMWMQEEPEQYRMRSSAFILMPSSDVADMPVMAYRRWHFDDGLLNIDQWSRCGNCYMGVINGKFRVAFDGGDRMKLTYVGGYDHDYSGWYRRADFNDDLRAEMEAQRESVDEIESMQARGALFAIEQYEFKSGKDRG